LFEFRPIYDFKETETLNARDASDLVGGNPLVPRRWWNRGHPVCSKMYVHGVGSLRAGIPQPAFVIVNANEI